MVIQHSSEAPSKISFFASKSPAPNYVSIMYYVNITSDMKYGVRKQHMGLWIDSQLLLLQMTRKWMQ